MELKDILKEISKNKKTLLISMALGLILGIGAYFFPKKYVAEGSFYIGQRPTDSTKLYYSYDGYYAQQAAESYTESFVALLESNDIKYTTLLELGTVPNSQNLRKVKSAIDVRKIGPQVVTLTVSDYNKEKSEKIWTIVTSQAVNSVGKDTLLIRQIIDRPFVHKRSDNLLINLLVGGLVLPSLTFIGLSFRKYLK